MSWQEKADSVMRICTETFTTEVIYKPCGGRPSKTIKTVFNDPYVEGVLLDGAPFQTRLYRLGVRLQDLDYPPAVNDKVEIGDKKFKVHEIRPDGDAGYVLLMHKDL